MALIKISDLAPTGSDLLMDSESYLNELTKEDISLVNGLGWITLSADILGVGITLSVHW